MPKQPRKRPHDVRAWETFQEALRDIRARRAPMLRALDPASRAAAVNIMTDDVLDALHAYMASASTERATRTGEGR